METKEKKRNYSIFALVVFVILLIVNIRVAAGVGTAFERALDGLVGGVILLLAVFFALRFFQCDKKECRGDGKFCLKNKTGV